MVEPTKAMTEAAVRELGEKTVGGRPEQRLVGQVLARGVRDLDGQQTMEGIAAAEFFTRGEHASFARAVGLDLDEVVQTLTEARLL
jgi:hypothetical protein